MKREFLEGLGLSKDIIDSIMSEYGKSISSLKEKTSSFDDLTSELNALKEEKGGIEGELAKIGKEYSDFKRGVISELIDEACPSSALAKKELMRILSEKESGSLKEAITELKNEHPDAFASKKSELPVFSVTASYTEIGSNDIKFRSVR